MRILLTFFLVYSGFLQGQILIDSIPLAQYGQSVNFWGLSGENGHLFLGKDSDGQIIEIDMSGVEVAVHPTPLDFNHGLVNLPDSEGWLIAEDYSSSGATAFVIDDNGMETTTYSFPAGITGPSAGIGGLALDNGDIWFTVYFPDEDADPFAYAYKWGLDTGQILDTVPLHGEQPQGIELIGDLIIYVTDNLNGDPEKMYGYDIVTDSDVFSIDLPDTQIDNDMSPRGLFWDGEFLWMVAKRQGASAFAYQTLYKYDMSGVLSSLSEFIDDRPLNIYPNPAKDRLNIDMSSLNGNETFRILDSRGRTILTNNVSSMIDVSGLANGIYELLIDGSIQTFIIQR